ncbi:MBG domain-containing protein [Imperialibacter roseus]|uniref:MBG domain-containing protein n=1 Tax=Imperialibacter roseus TaxID=1324217 RepID=A0ABZ0IS70_9BACT|nr:MBG domain-containing protein [Imperialibacter roseus]WOK07347.1 MBG domain-containing protein [Imperialibacter roseus]
MIRYFLSACLWMIGGYAISQPVGWEVDPSEYEYSASFTWQVQFTSSTAVDGTDYLAAFVDGEVRGVVSSLYHPGFEKYFFPILVYSNSVNEEGLTFKYYDASEGATYQIDNEYQFVLDRSSGSYSDPLLFTVDDRLSQTIAFGALERVSYGAGPYELTATATSGLTVSYASSDQTVATVSGSTLTVVGAGSVTITASQGGADTYRAAEDVPQVLVVDQAGQTITFEAIDKVDISVGSVQLTASASSGLDVAYSLVSGSATLSGNTLTLTGTGEVVVAADQEGDANYLEAVQVIQSFSVTDSSKQHQQIVFDQLEEQSYGGGSFELLASASSGLSVSYASSNTAVATISGSTVTIVGAGSTEITASQLGDDSYNPADEVVRTLVVNKASQTISIDSLADVDISAGSIELTASATSGLEVEFTLRSGPGILSENILTLTGSGAIYIAADQAGNDNYAAADQVLYSFFVTETGRQAQSITFGALDEKTYGDESFELTATASSELTVAYSSSNDNIASISGSTVTIVGAGSVIITASQPGNDMYEGAPDKVQLLIVNKANLMVVADDKIINQGEDLGEFTVSYAGFVNGESADSLDVQPTASVSIADASQAGTYTIKVSGGDDDNYSLSYAEGTLTIETVLGVKEKEFIHVYPNPATDYLIIESSEIKYVEVFDYTGRRLKSQELTDGEVDLTGLHEGIHLLRLSDSDGRVVATMRFMKKG